MTTELRSPCPIAAGLDIFGDRWTLLVVRDLFYGSRLYGELANSKETIPTNLLADRLKRLEEYGLITRELYQEKPKRYAYELTDAGRQLKPVLQSMAAWGAANRPGTRKVNPAL
jgi:DNA-binding HxlR family transcriptional regulator